MTEKQKLFADEYLIDLNATRAYKAVYQGIKSDEVARKSGSRLLTKADVKTYIGERLEDIHNKKTADAQEVLEYLASVLRGESRAAEIVIEGVGDGCSTARIMMKGPSEKEKLKAAELIGKRHNLFIDKVQAEIMVPSFSGEGDL